MNQAEKQFISIDLQLFADEGATDTDTTQNIGAEFAKASWEEKAQMLRSAIDQEENQEEQEEQQESSGEAAETEQPETGSEEEAKPTEPTYKIKVGGEEKDVPLSELIKLAQQGEDYTRKTQAVSQERKELDEMKAKLEMLASQTQPKIDPLAEANREIETFRQEFLRVTGQEYNEWDMAHQAIFLDYKQQGAYHKAQQQQLTTVTNNIRQTVQAQPDILADFDNAMYALLNSGEAGRAEFDKVYQAKARTLHGTPTVDDINLVDSFYQKVQALKAVPAKPVPKVVPQQKQTPPKVERAGAVEIEDSKPTFNKKAWASADADGQKSMLRKLRESGQI